LKITPKSNQPTVQYREAGWGRQSRPNPAPSPITYQYQMTQPHNHTHTQSPFPQAKISGPDFVPLQKLKNI